MTRMGAVERLLKWKLMFWGIHYSSKIPTCCIKLDRMLCTKFWLAYCEFNFILMSMVQSLFLVQLTKKPKIPVPWLLYPKSAKDYLDMDCLSEGFVIADPSKITKNVTMTCLLICPKLSTRKFARNSATWTLLVPTMSRSLWQEKARLLMLL